MPGGVGSMKGEKQMIYKNLRFKADPFSYDLEFDDRITLVGGDSGIGKTVLYEMLEDIRLTDGYKAIRLFNYKSDDFLEAIKQCRNSFIVIDNADCLINDDVRRFINFELSNQYMFPHLFNSLSVVIPVLSSTFASVGRFLKHAGNMSLGMLIIDESGQAMPQSALGALYRTRQAVVVGDPLQVEPVVRKYISLDNKNQYLIIGRNPKNLFTTSDNLFELVSEKMGEQKEFSLKEYL